jgi:hypothetical protein
MGYWDVREIMVNILNKTASFATGASVVTASVSFISGGPEPMVEVG